MSLKKIGFIIYVLLFTFCSKVNNSTNDLSNDTKPLNIKFSLVDNSTQTLSNDLEPLNIDSYNFFGEPNQWVTGHAITHLSKIISLFKNKHKIYFLGDSLLDNKYWFPHEEVDNLPNIYRYILKKPFLVKKDVAFHLNGILEKYDNKYITINCAIEASRLKQRFPNLGPIDKLVADNLTENDILVISIGGNDLVAQKDELHKLSENFNDSGIINLFSDLLITKTQDYIKQIIKKNKPKFIILLFPPFPHESQQGWIYSFAEKFNYYNDPQSLKNTFKYLFENFTKKVVIDNVKIIPLPLYDIFDSNDITLYKHGIEPSVEGGKLMAQKLWEIINKEKSD